MNIRKINKQLQKHFGNSVVAKEEDSCIKVSGKLQKWEQVIKACSIAAEKNSKIHVVNDITCLEVKEQKMHMPTVSDKSLDGLTPDVLIIGGGISGASIARELSKWDINILLVDKEPDLAMQASGRNDGEVHPGVDLSKGSLKHHYIRSGNKMFDKVCKELDVPFSRVGQYVCFNKLWLRPVIEIYCLIKRFRDGIEDTTIISGKELRKREPNLGGDFKFAISNPSSGCVCPYGLTIAYAENAVTNGATVSLNTAVTGMKVDGNKIISVDTNRGTIYPEIVINAAGVFAEDIAIMAKDRFFSIHPRRGTNSILDKKAGKAMGAIASIFDLSLKKTHSKGGGILHTVHHNLLLGPDAVETYEKENTETRKESINTVFTKQKKTMPTVNERDIITYFTGVRAPTFEEDFIIEKGRKTENIIHCAGIQSPGLTTAPAVALDIEKMAVEMLSSKKNISKNNSFNPYRKGVVRLHDMDDAQRNELIRKNPDYGIIICRCEEISRGEIIDALNSPIPVATIDGIKKRIRPGMGRCQGGFCSPLVTQIIAEHLGVDMSEVRKSSNEAVITYGKTK